VLKRTRSLVGALAAVGVVAVVSAAQNPPAPVGPPVNPNLRHSTYSPVDGKGGQEVSGAYEVAKGWPQPVIEGWTINADLRRVAGSDHRGGPGHSKVPVDRFLGTGRVSLTGPGDRSRRPEARIDDRGLTTAAEK
jgi:hypothetical protein